MDASTRTMFDQAAAFLKEMEEQESNPFSGNNTMEPWVADFVDVGSIHAEATTEIEKLIKSVRKKGRSGARLLLGDPATGKSHVLARIRKNLFTEVFFCFVETITGKGSNVFRHILSNIVRDLLRTAPGATHSQFRQLCLEFIRGTPRNAKEHNQNLRAWREDREFDFVTLIDHQVKAAGKSIQPSFIRVVYNYLKRYQTNPRVRIAIENWLRGNPVNEQELQLIEFTGHPSVDSEDLAKELIQTLGIVTSFSRPVFLCFDQVEAYLYDEEAFKAFVRAVEYIHDNTHNYVIVTAALLTFDERLRGAGITPSTWDRFNDTKKPILINPLTPEEGELLLNQRLAPDCRNLKIFLERSLFPFCSQDVEEILTPFAATTRTLKQARYILKDAESVFDAIVAANPSAGDIEMYFENGSRLHGGPKERPNRMWPTPQSIESYLAEKLEECLVFQKLNLSDMRIDENRDRDIVHELLSKVISSGLTNDYFGLSELTLRKGTRVTGCDFTFTVAGPQGTKRKVGVHFCNETNANVVKARLKRGATLLESKDLDQLFYVMDSRVNITEKSQEYLREFENKFNATSPEALVCKINKKILCHLTAMRRLFELAVSGDLTMYDPNSKKGKCLMGNEVFEYLLRDRRLLENELIRTLLEGTNHCRILASCDDELEGIIIRGMRKHFLYPVATLCRELQGEADFLEDIDDTALYECLGKMQEKGLVQVLRTKQGGVVRALFSMRQDYEKFEG